MIILASAQHIWSNIHPVKRRFAATQYISISIYFIELSPSPGKNLSICCCCCSLYCMAKCFPPHPFPAGKQLCLSLLLLGPIIIISSPPVRGEIHSWPPGNIYTLQTQDIMLSTGNLLLLWQSFHFFHQGIFFLNFANTFIFLQEQSQKRKLEFFSSHFYQGWELALLLFRSLQKKETLSAIFYVLCKRMLCSLRSFTFLRKEQKRTHRSFGFHKSPKT